MLVCVVAHAAQPEVGVLSDQLDDVIDQLDNSEYVLCVRLVKLRERGVSARRVLGGSTSGLMFVSTRV